MCFEAGVLFVIGWRRFLILNLNLLESLDINSVICKVAATKGGVEGESQKFDYNNKMQRDRDFAVRCFLNKQTTNNKMQQDQDLAVRCFFKRTFLLFWFSLPIYLYFCNIFFAFVENENFQGYTKLFLI